MSYITSYNSGVIRRNRMNIINKIVDWCFEEKKIVKKDERHYIPCSSYFLKPLTSKENLNETEKFLNEIFASN